MVNGDQDSSSEDENTEKRPGQKGNVVKLLKYYGLPKHFKNEVGFISLIFCYFLFSIHFPPLNF